MAPNGEAAPSAVAAVPFLATIIGNRRQIRVPSWHELQDYHGGDGHGEVELPPGGGELVVEDAECECCGMSEECTPAYISSVRRRFSGRWVCGLCAEAVAEEAGKNGAGGGGGAREAALAAHMGVCRRFNGFGRTHPALFQADAMRDILRKLSGLASPTPRSPKAGADLPPVA